MSFFQFLYNFFNYIELECQQKNLNKNRRFSISPKSIGSKTSILNLNGNCLRKVFESIEWLSLQTIVKINTWKTIHHALESLLRCNFYRITHFGLNLTEKKNTELMNQRHKLPLLRSIPFQTETILILRVSWAEQSHRKNEWFCGATPPLDSLAVNDCLFTELLANHPIWIANLI